MEDPDMIACDDGEHFVSLRKDWDWYGWVLRRHPDGGTYSVRKATPDELRHAMTRRFFDSIPVLPVQRPPERLA